MKFSFDDLLKEMQEMHSSERDLQKKKSQEMDEYRSSKNKSKEDDVDEDDEAEPIDAKDNEENVNLDGIIDKINIIRAGTSLRTKEGRNDLKSYFNRLNDAERLALFAFVSGLADVMASAEPAGSDAVTPADPYRVDIEMDDDEKKPKKSSSKSGQEKKSAQPIVVGENANKLRELKVLRANR